ncbi:Intracellular septation protein A [Candidatus Hepatincolaceae symbiont of Richtersius coronifer]
MSNSLPNITNAKGKKKYPIFLEILPLFLFFIINKFYGIFVATGVLIVFSLLNLIMAYVYTKVFHLIPLITTFLAVLFGGLTLILHNGDFIKIKITLMNLLFALILITGLVFKKNFLRLLLADGLSLKDKGWHILTISWSSFFMCLAIMNEIVWRHFSTDTWVNFKVFGILGLSIAFTLLQLPIVHKYKQ